MAKKDKKLTLEQMIEQLDAAKKVNPLDLSSDQDLTIALMNLVSLEEHFFFSGAKTGKVGFYDLINVVREMRKELMQRIVEKNTTEHGEIWCISKHLLAASMRVKEVGDKANAAGNAADAADLYAKAYDLYSLFWGINMDLIDMKDVHQIEGNIYDIAMKDPEMKKSDKKVATKAQKSNVAKSGADQSVTKRLGAWVKNAVNCCIE
ncbi:hypothetical protein LJC18_01205 [Lachnospiraceae bacterium OttesenSCG-928-E19]|nr:hypothetical protein [Lachnospiraceae bacterium OttesenSCG-928-E19]